MPRRYLIITLILIFFSLVFGLCGSARATTNDDLGKAIKDFGLTCLEDTKAILTAPGRWEREQWLKTALVAGTTMVLLDSDRSIREYFQQHRTGFGDDLSEGLDKAGNVCYLLPALGVWYLYGRATGNFQARETAVASLESLMIAGGFNGLIKLAFRRSRPYTGNGAHDFNGPALDWEDEQLSFCSMHSAAAFAVATVLAGSYQDRPLVPVLSYAAAALVALSRLNQDKHWSSDVFFGGAVGYFTAKKVLVLRSKRLKEAAAVSLVPALTPRGASLVLEYRF